MGAMEDFLKGGGLNSELFPLPPTDYGLSCA